MCLRDPNPGLGYGGRVKPRIVQRADQHLLLPLTVFQKHIQRPGGCLTVQAGQQRDAVDLAACRGDAGRQLLLRNLKQPLFDADDLRARGVHALADFEHLCARP